MLVSPIKVSVANLRDTRNFDIGSLAFEGKGHGVTATDSSSASRWFKGLSWEVSIFFKYKSEKANNFSLQQRLRSRFQVLRNEESAAGDGGRFDALAQGEDEVGAVGGELKWDHDF